jgi:hypothetical protein
MSILVQTSEPAPLRTPNIREISLLYGGILVVLALAQLYSFPEMLLIVQSFWLPGDRVTAYLLAAMIVICEVFALPFLLRMRMSSAARVTSMVLGWMVAVIWTGISVWLLVTTNAVTSTGMLGDVVTIPPGGLPLMLGLAFGVLAAWASWGMWPVKSNVK